MSLCAFPPSYLSRFRVIPPARSLQVLVNVQGIPQLSAHADAYQLILAFIHIKVKTNDPNKQARNLLCDVFRFLACNHVNFSSFVAGRYSSKFAPRNLKIPKIDNYYDDVKKDSARLVLHLWKVCQTYRLATRQNSWNLYRLEFFYLILFSQSSCPTDFYDKCNIII